jgi:hypothetical protein
MPAMTRNEQIQQTPDADRDWFGGRRWTGIAALALVILVAVCGLLLVEVRRGHHSASRASGHSPGRTFSPSPADALPTVVPTAAPAAAVWTLYQTIALPTLPGAGPSHVDGAIASGYADTPLGALVAVVNEGYRYGLAPDSQWRPAAQAMLAPGPGYNAWLKLRAQHPYGQQGAAGGDPASLTQVVGFQFASYTPSDAVIQVVTRDSDGNLQVGTEHVAWLSGDWKFVLAPDGSQVSNVQTIDSLAGFVQWEGV